MNVQQWINEYEKDKKNMLVRVLIGNKCGTPSLSPSLSSTLSSLSPHAPLTSSFLHPHHPSYIFFFFFFIDTTHRQVSVAEAEAFAATRDMKYFETRYSFHSLSPLLLLFPHTPFTLFSPLSHSPSTLPNSLLVFHTLIFVLFSLFLSFYFFIFLFFYFFIFLFFYFIFLFSATANIGIDEPFEYL